MPSGGHGGGGGSHFGGGSSSSGGGGSHFGGSGGGGYHRPVHMRGGRRVYVYHFGGRRYYMGTGAASALPGLIFGFIFSLIIALVMWVIPADNNSEIKKIESDHAKYVSFIERAQEDDRYMIQGKVLTMYEYGESSGKYYITYSFTAPSNPALVVRGYSFSIYTYDQARTLVDLYSGGEFNIALEVPKENIVADNYNDIDSVNADYINYSLGDDIEYINLKNAVPVALIFRIIATVACAGCLIGIVVLLKKNFKKDTEPVSQSLGETKSAPHYCKYCGSALKDGQSKCPNCGGSQK